MNWCRFFGESIYLGLTNYNILTLLCSSKVSSFLLPQTKTRSRLGKLMLPGTAPWGLRCHSLKTHCSVLENLFGALDTSSRSGPWEGFQELSLSLDGEAWLSKITDKGLGFLWDTNFYICASFNYPTLAFTNTWKRNLEFDYASPAKLGLCSLWIQGQFQKFGRAFLSRNWVSGYQEGAGGEKV